VLLILRVHRRPQNCTLRCFEAIDGEIFGEGLWSMSGSTARTAKPLLWQKAQRRNDLLIFVENTAQMRMTEEDVV
jgi:hypothetical protein